jgi:hypothetical protein
MGRMIIRIGGMGVIWSPMIEKEMNRYLIETPHTDQDCHRLVEQVYAMGYLYHFDWGCMAGVHCGWAIIEAENEA